MSVSSRLHFPAKIYQIVEMEDSDIIRWEHDGKSFRIYDYERFEKEIIPKYFRHCRIASVQRQLNLYGFKCVSRGEDKGSFYHPQFRRGEYDSVREIRRTVLPQQGKKESGKSSPIDEEVMRVNDPAPPPPPPPTTTTVNYQFPQPPMMYGFPSGHMPVFIYCNTPMLGMYNLPNGPNGHLEPPTSSCGPGPFHPGQQSPHFFNSAAGSGPGDKTGHGHGHGHTSSSSQPQVKLSSDASDLTNRLGLVWDNHTLKNRQIHPISEGSEDLGDWGDLSWQDEATIKSEMSWPRDVTVKSEMYPPLVMASPEWGDGDQDFLSLCAKLGADDGHTVDTDHAGLDSFFGLDPT